ncbi:hypothetical protein [Parashewanella tropica]|uniref:hypothetical protein n=1 Tax=Parashewanella tropica TaxID=2547970 RepID=UPI001059689F|nr:hypothetical protein [Parashewanella tropica]
MYVKLLILMLFLSMSIGCKSIPKGGALPINTNKELELNVLSIDWSGFSLALGQRRIKDTGFIVGNLSQSFNGAAAFLGPVGVLASDLANEKHLSEPLESELQKHFDLAQAFYEVLIKSQDLNESNISINSRIDKGGLILEPWCLIFENKNGLLFMPQLKAILESANGDIIWEGNYGSFKINKAINIQDTISKAQIVEIKSRLSRGYNDIAKQLIANMQGKDHYVENDKTQEVMDKLTNLDSIKLDDKKIED